MRSNSAAIWSTLPAWQAIGTALPPSASIDSATLFEPFLLPRCEDDGSALLGETTGNGLPDTARSAGDECDLVGEAEVEDGHGLRSPGLCLVLVGA